MRETGIIVEPSVIEFQKIGDEETGYLSVAQYDDSMPFEIKRVFWVHDTPPYMERGNHAHKQLTEVVVAINGVAEIELENQLGKKYNFKLSDRNQGLIVPNMHWVKVRLQAGAILLCLCSHEFNEKDYIRDYKEFKKL